MSRVDQIRVLLARLSYALFTALLLVAPLRAVLAHSFQPAVLDLRERNTGIFEVAWKTPRPVAGWGTPSGELVPQLPGHCQRLASPGEQAPQTLGEELGPVYWRVDCGVAGLRGGEIAVAGLDGSRIDVIVRITWRDGKAHSGLLRRGTSHFVVPGGHSANGQGIGGAAGVVLRDYLGLGIQHILLGLDHLLFVLALLLLVESRGMLLKTISAFTVAHSVTLVLVARDLLTVPSALVEALIALSIVLLAAELTRPRDAPPTLARRYPWLVASVFGLLHGSGFASALGEIGLPAGHIPIALLAFNLGVEVGQLLFIIAVLGPLATLARIRWPWPEARLVPAYAIGVLAAAWTIERIRGFWI